MNGKLLTITKEAIEWEQKAKSLEEQLSQLRQDRALPVDHLSYSSFSAFQDCPRLWKHKYIDKIKAKSKPALVFGKAFHTTLERVVLDRAGGYTKDIYDVWDEMLQAELAKEADNMEWGETDSADTLNELGQRFWGDPDILKGIAEIVPMKTDTEWLVEKKIELILPGIDIPIIGYIDIVTADGIICDFKTSGVSWTEDKAQKEMQPRFYLAAAGDEPWVSDPYRFRHYVFVKNRKPKMQVIETEWMPGDIWFMAASLSQVYRAMLSGVFQCNPWTWRCNERFCDYYKECRG